MTEYLSAFVCIVGLLIYIFVYVPQTTPPVKPRTAEIYGRVIEIGRIMFWVGLLVFLAHRDHVVNLLGGK